VGRRAKTRERAQAVALHARGLRVNEIAERLDLSPLSVLALFRRPSTFAERACELCGERFMPTNGRQRFCSAHTYEARQHSQAKLRECRQCGQPFLVTGQSGRRYCTSEHRREHERQGRVGVETVTGWRRRVEALEAEVERARTELAAREAA